MSNPLTIAHKNHAEAKVNAQAAEAATAILEDALGRAGTSEVQKDRFTRLAQTHALVSIAKSLVAVNELALERHEAQVSLLPRFVEQGDR
jgi:hypothetical protein